MNELISVNLVPFIQFHSNMGQIHPKLDCRNPFLFALLPFASRSLGLACGKPSKFQSQGTLIGQCNVYNKNMTSTIWCVDSIKYRGTYINRDKGKRKRKKTRNVFTHLPLPNGTVKSAATLSHPKSIRYFISGNQEK